VAATNGERWMTMSNFVTAVLVTVAAALLERLVVRLARSLWGAFRPAAA
jgi:hypothetical protein